MLCAFPGELHFAEVFLVNVRFLWILPKLAKTAILLVSVGVDKTGTLRGRSLVLSVTFL